MTKITLILAMVLSASACFAEWQIVEVRTEPFIRESYKGPPEVQMNLSIRNVSKSEIFVWGQDFGSNIKYYHIESFIKNAENDVWERQNSGMCRSEGKIGWIRIDPGEIISLSRVLFKKYIGRQMILTFRRAYSEGDEKGSEILLGPFEIPEIKDTAQSMGSDSDDFSKNNICSHTFCKTYKINIPCDNYIIISMCGFGADNYLVLDMNENDLCIYSPYDYKGLLLERKLTSKEIDSIHTIFESKEYKNVPERNMKTALDAEEIEIFSFIKKNKKYVHHIMPDAKIIRHVIDLYKELNVVPRKR